MLEKIKAYLAENGADAWVIYDFAAANPAYIRLVGNTFSTRKCFLIIGADGDAVIVCHVIDLPGIQASKKAIKFRYEAYRTWQEMDRLLENNLSGKKRVMMEISDNGLLPRSSFADYGTVCSVKRFVEEVVSSADLFQSLSATFEGESLCLHKRAAEAVNAIKDEAFAKISKDVRQKGFADEYEVQQFILERFRQEGMVTDSAPIVAIGKNANSPHYEPTEENHSLIKKGDLVLIDLWAKYDRPDAVFADITWMGYVGSAVPAAVQKVFDTVKTAIDRALAFLERELPRRDVCGYEVDDVCNRYMTEQGYGEYIVHRTGHSISLGESDHGVGVNIDNFETHDTRRIIEHVAFSLEPALYLPEFGLREEINVYIDGKKPHVYTPRQEKIILL